MPTPEEVKRRMEKMGSFIDKPKSLANNPTTSPPVRKRVPTVTRNRAIREAERKAAGIKTGPTEKQTKLKKFLKALGINF